MNLENFIKQFYTDHAASSNHLFDKETNGGDGFKYRFIQEFLSEFIHDRLELSTVMQLVQILRFEKNKNNNDIFSQLASDVQPVGSFFRQSSHYTTESSTFRARALVLLNKTLIHENNSINEFRDLWINYQKFLCHSFRIESYNKRAPILKKLSDFFLIAAKYPEFCPMSKATAQEQIDAIAQKMVSEILTLDMTLQDRKTVLDQLLDFGFATPFSESATMGVGKATLEQLQRFLNWIGSKVSTKLGKDRPSLTSGDLEIFQSSLALLPEHTRQTLRLDVLRLLNISDVNHVTTCMADFVITNNERLFVDNIKNSVSAHPSDQREAADMLTIFLFVGGELNKPCWTKVSQKTREEINNFLNIGLSTLSYGSEARQIVAFWLSTFETKDTESQSNPKKQSEQNVDLIARVALLEEIVRNQNRILQSLRRKKRR